MKSVTENVVSDILGQDCLLAIIEQGMAYHIVIKTLVKFEFIALRHDGHIY